MAYYGDGRKKASRLPRPILGPYSSPVKTPISYKDTSSNSSSVHSNMRDRYYEPIGSRKRSRPESSGEDPEDWRGRDHSKWVDVDCSLHSIGTASPAPLANDHYRLAGGISTPIQQSAAQFEDLNSTSESYFRRRWSSAKITNDGRQTILVGALDRERNGHKRSNTEPIQSHYSQSWGSYMVNTIGGLAGKVWNFCTAGAFQGFTAGGGNGYTVNGIIIQPAEADSGINRRLGASGSPFIPGEYPTDDGHGAEEDSVEMRPAKRQQTSHSGDWVMVNRQDSSPQTSLSSRTTTSRIHSSASRPSLRANVVRRPRISATRVSSYTGSPQQSKRHQRDASYASPRASLSSPERLHPRSPSSAAVEADVQRYAAKRQREVKESSDSMKRLNAQLQAMIREGKEALATKVEVFDDFETHQEDQEDMIDGYGYAD